MAYIVHDYVCENCSAEWEDLVDRATLTSVCPSCGTETNKPTIATPGIATFSLMDKSTKEAHLKKRSADHTKKEVKKEAERWGAEGKKRAREGTIQVGYGKK